MVLLFSYLPEVSKNVGRLLVASLFVIGGLSGLYGLLLSAFSKIQQEPEKSKTHHRLRVVSWAGSGVVVIFLLLLLMNWVLGAPFDTK
jgi:H+/Cl- antiporter ClcA